MSKGLHILVVDDDLDLAESLAEILIAHGHSVDTAHSGPDAIRLYRSCRHDIVFMDVQMEGMNGVDAFLAIREFAPEAKVIIMTGFGAEELLVKAENNGALDIMHKPVNITEVFGIISRITPCGRVLIAVQDHGFAQKAATALNAEGYSVAAAETCREAGAMVLEGDIDVLLLDLGLADLCQSQLYRQILKLGERRPNVIVTGYCQEDSPALRELERVTDVSLASEARPVERLISTLRNLDSENAKG